MDKGKTKAIDEWPIPQKVQDIQVLLGFANYYQRFIEGFAHIVLPITNLLQKDTEWDWTLECQLAFETLKSKFTEAPVLVMPDPTKPQKIETDTSDYAYGAILSQLEEDGKWHPVAYLSKSFSPAERNYNIYDKELKGIIGALETWQHYLEGATHTIEIWTDHKNLEYFKHAHKLSRRQARWHNT
jgi:uncharacterized protein Usg